MSMSVRTRIDTAILAALGAVANVGLVMPPGSRSPGGSKTIEETVASGKHALEVVLGIDEVFSDTGEQRLTLKDSWRFSVEVLAHLAEGRVEAAYITAGELQAALYRVHQPLPPVGDWRSLALETQPLGGGGGVFITELGTLATGHGFEVRYRTKRGDPEVAG